MDVPTLAALKALGARLFTRGPVVTPEDHGCVGNGTTDDTVNLRAAFTAAAAVGRPLRMTRGATYKITQQASSDVAAITLPSNLEWDGNGATVLIAGLNGTVVWPDPASLPGNPGMFNGIQVPNTGHDISIRGVKFLGERTSYIASHQCSAIDVAIPASAGAVHDVVIEDNTFTSLWGLSVHQQGGALRVHVRNNTFTLCNNTVNNNADYSEVSGNFFDRSSGIEASGSHQVIAHNIIYDCPGTSSTISLGGRTSGPYGFGTVCSGNVLDRCAGGGIVVADGTSSYVISGNTIRRTKKQGILAVGGATNKVKNLIVTGNTVVSAGDAAGSGVDGSRVGIYIGGSTEGVTLAGNRVSVGDDAAYSTVYAHLCDGVTGLSLIGNIAEGTYVSPSGHLSLSNCPNTNLSGNKFDYNKIGITGTSTLDKLGIGGLTFLKGGNDEGIIFLTALPEGVTSASPGVLAICPGGATGAPANQNGFTLWVKEYGASNVGWVPVGGSTPYLTKTANYTIVSSEGTVIFNGTSLTATLPDPSNAFFKGRIYRVKNVNSSALTVVSGGTSKTIDGAASVSLAQWQVGRYMSDGSQWLTV